MSWKGRHARNWIRPGIGSWCDEYEVTHEVESENYGLFGVFERGYHEDWLVFWRPNRNCTTEWKIKVMSEKVASQYSSYMHDEEIVYASEAEAIAAIAHWQENFEHPEKRKRYRPRDSQKSKVYRWEHLMARELGGVESLDGRNFTTAILERKRDHAHLHTYLSKVCRELGEEKPTLRFRSGGRHSFGGYSGIQLLPSHCSHLILLHELAHIVHKKWGDKTNGEKHQSHGKEFVGIYAYLLIRFEGIDKDEIIRHANKHKIKFLLPEQYWEWKESQSKEKSEAA